MMDAGVGGRADGRRAGGTAGVLWRTVRPLRFDIRPGTLSGTDRAACEGWKMAGPGEVLPGVGSRGAGLSSYG